MIVLAPLVGAMTMWSGCTTTPKPSWDEANTLVDGHPAFRDPPSVVDHVEYMRWFIRLYDQGSLALELQVALDDSATEAIRQRIEELIDRIELPDVAPE